ncbi:MAG: cell division protein DivIC [Cyclobacteriaceae bacterium]
MALFLYFRCMIQRLWGRIPKIFKNFYVLAGAFFLIWLTVFDSNDLITQYRLSNKQAELESTKDFYLEQIEDVKSDREALLNDEALLEKMAREKYYMKKEGEDVFVVVEE